jgi:hypothetical protein
MKKAILPVSLLLLFVLLAAMAGCSKDSTSSTNTNPPATPTSLSASQTSRNAVALTWNVSNADTVNVERSTDSSSWAPVATLSGNAASWTDTTILANEKFYYHVRARNSYGQSDYSNVASIWTLPAVYDFSTDQTGHFTAESLGSGVYHIWEWDSGIQAGKLTITNPTGASRTVSVYANYSMHNSGWFQSKLRVQQWHGTGDSANYATFFIEKSVSDTTGNIIQLWFQQDSTLFGFRSSGAGAGLNRVATNPELPLLSGNQMHAIRLFHLAAHWDLYVDENLVWSGEIPNVASGGYNLIEEWQFDPGAASNPSNQVFWIDDVANDQTSPTAIIANPGRAPVSILNDRALAKRK